MQALGGSRYDPRQSPAGARRQMLDRVPRGATVLDVGCWSGFAGKYLIRERSAQVEGIEPRPEMAELAEQVYRRVLREPAESGIPLLEDQGCRYDRVLFLDVLEHLVDPGAVLRRARRLLSPGGSGLFSIPNVAHWSVRKELLLGRFRYADNGLLDRTHLRFYTLETAEDLLVESGWTVFWRGHSLGQPPLLSLDERLLRALSRWPTLFAVQGLFEAGPTESVRGRRPASAARP